MFVIACKFVPENRFIFDLVASIREFHPDEKICVVDSDSEDKTYAIQLEKYDVIFLDAKNRNHMIGAYWHAYQKFPNEDFYYFMHDSMLVKSNLDYLKTRDLVTLCYFDRNQGNFNSWSSRVEDELNLPYTFEGLGCYGPIFFCANTVMKKLDELKIGEILPRSKQETGFCEGLYGFFFEYIGFDLKACALFGDVLVNESNSGRSGVYPHKTDWQFPIEKFYGSHLGGERACPSPESTFDRNRIMLKLKKETEAKYDLYKRFFSSNGKK